MLYVLGKLVECVGCIIIAFVVFAVIFEAVMWLVERIFDDEQG